MAGRIDKNKNRDQKMTSTLMEIAGDRASGNESSIFNGAIGREVGELLQPELQASVFIPHKNIYKNPLNVPYMEGITEDNFQALKLSILDTGLLHNLVVIDDGKGSYRLLSGEKRWTAIGKMTDEEMFKCFPKGIECKVIPYSSERTQDDELIMLLTCNVLTFSSGTPEPRQLRDLLRLYRKRGYQNSDLIEYLSGCLKISNKTMYRLLAETQATDELYTLYVNGKINRSALQILGDLSGEVQKVICKEIEKETGIVNEKTAQTYKRLYKGNSKSKADSTENTIHYGKFEKSYKSVTSEVNKIEKLRFNEMNQTERKLTVSELNNMIGKLNKLINAIEKNK